MSRERFKGLRSWVIPYGLMAVACLTIGLSIGTSLAHARSQQIEDVSRLASSSVRSTDQARIGHLADELALLPTEVVASAVHVGAYFINHNDGTQGSGTIIDYDNETGYGYGLTARHVLEPLQGPDAPVSTILVSRPQYSPEQYSVVDDDFCIAKSRSHDYAVFGFKLTGLHWGSLGLDNVNVHWQPSSQEDLFALGYPETAEFNKNIFPMANFHLRRNFHYPSLGNLSELVTDIFIDHGASGAGIARKIKSIIELVGIWVGFSPSGGVFTPINNEYSQLLADCKADLEH